MAKNYCESFFVVSVPLDPEFTKGCRYIVCYLQVFQRLLLIFCGFSTMNAVQTAMIVHGGKQDISP
jgi:hypothetical protein